MSRERFVENDKEEAAGARTQQVHAHSSGKVFHKNAESGMQEESGQGGVVGTVWVSRFEWGRLF